jgi:hypothetical protein
LSIATHIPASVLLAEPDETLATYLAVYAERT